MRFFFFFNDTATTEIYTLSLHDALPIWIMRCRKGSSPRLTGTPFWSIPTRGSFWISCGRSRRPRARSSWAGPIDRRSEEHTSELQSRQYLVCRLLLEKKKNKKVVTMYEI